MADGKKQTNSGSTSATNTTPSWSLPGGTALDFNREGFANQVGSDIRSLYSQGPTPQNTYAGLGSTTQHGLNMLGAQTNQDYGFGKAIDYSNNLVANGGLNAGQQGALGTGNEVANGYRNLGQNGGLNGTQQGALDDTNFVSNGYMGLQQNGGLTGAQSGISNQYGQLANSAGGPSMTERNLSGVANGSYLNGANPYFEANLSRSLDDARSGVNASIGSSGRYGSNVMAESLGNTLGGLSNQARAQQYETERDRQMQANAAIDTQRNQGFNNQLSALGQQFGAQQQGVTNQFGALSGRLGAANQAFGFGQQGATNQFNGLAGQLGAANQIFGQNQTGVSNALGAGQGLGQLYQNSLLPGQTKLQLGAMQDADAQARLNSNNAAQNAGFNHVQQYLGLLGNQPEQSTEQPWWQTALGVGATGAGIFGTVANGMRALA